MTTQITFTAGRNNEIRVIHQIGDYFVYVSHGEYKDITPDQLYHTGDFLEYADEKEAEEAFYGFAKLMDAKEVITLN